MMDLPLGPEEVSLTFNRNVRRSRSPFTGRSQTQKPLNEWWEGELRIAPLQDAEAAQWRAFVIRVGITEAFRLGPYRENRGSLSGTPEVSGANQKGRKLLTSGWNSSAEGVLLPGDHIEVDEYLYMVTAVADADSSGVAEIRLWPRLRTRPQGGAPITVDNPRGRFRLAERENPWEIRPGRFTDIRLSIREAL